MPRAAELKKGQVVRYKDQMCIVRIIDVQNPSARGAATLYKVRFSTIPEGAKLEDRFKGDDQLPDVDLIRREVTYSYDDGEFMVFMDTEDYSQFPVSRDALGDQVLYISEDLQGALALLVDGNVVALELPATIELTVVDTTPVIKGASAAARTKPATCNTGLVVQVPEYLAPGEKIRVNVDEARYISRA
ncbi:MAG: elongation factor P-like protein YeiP [Pseudomonadales bacterium]